MEFHESGCFGNYAYPPEIGCLKCGYKITGMAVGMKDEGKAMAFSDDLLINWWNKRAKIEDQGDE